MESSGIEQTSLEPGLKEVAFDFEHHQLEFKPAKWLAGITSHPAVRSPRRNFHLARHKGATQLLASFQASDPEFVQTL